MRKLKVIFINKTAIYSAVLAILVLISVSLILYVLLRNTSVNIFSDPDNGVIVIDAGHGGVDGGTSAGNILEKDINLAISKNLKTFLEQEGYKVILTREEDISLDGSRNALEYSHQKSLNARANIINSSNAQLFLSIHVNSNPRNPQADGSIVFYNDMFSQNKILAYYVQRSLNSMIINGRKQTIRDPQKAEFFILKHSNIPGIIIETAFLSNARERELLQQDEFREEVAKAIAKGVVQYLSDPQKALIPDLKGGTE